MTYFVEHEARVQRKRLYFIEDAHISSVPFCPAFHSVDDALRFAEAEALKRPAKLTAGGKALEYSVFRVIREHDDSMLFSFDTLVDNPELLAEFRGR